MSDAAALAKKLWEMKEVHGRRQGADEAVCKLCHGPRSSQRDNVCNGCGRLITKDPKFGGNPDTAEAHCWHAVGKRPTEPEDVEVGQAWLYEPFPGEGSIWIVRKREEGELGPLLTMKQYSPPTPEQPDEQFARAMLENGEWTFLRHGYPTDLEDLAELLKVDGNKAAKAGDSGWVVGMVRRGPILNESNKSRNYGQSDGAFAGYHDYKLETDRRGQDSQSYDWRVKSLTTGTSYGVNEDWPSVLLDGAGKPVAQGWKAGEWRVVAFPADHPRADCRSRVLKVKVEIVGASHGPGAVMQVWVESAKQSVVIASDTPSVLVKK